MKKLVYGFISDKKKGGKFKIHYRLTDRIYSGCVIGVHFGVIINLAYVVTILLK
ncbi:hypothetical protein N9H57_03345 [Flavobacteriaceae bacterium]|nr:hypothetical protein [Flavobacteriaceae bacterium]MDB3862491.1 hypothetical protein [Flavobacteriaceae bacterium]MDC3354203.1 hypothetical protein [Flavobacteriaceae bacterium]